MVILWLGRAAAMLTVYTYYNYLNLLNLAWLLLSFLISIKQIFRITIIVILFPCVIEYLVAYVGNIHNEVQKYFFARQFNSKAF